MADYLIHWTYPISDDEKARRVMKSSISYLNADSLAQCLMEAAVIAIGDKLLENEVPIGCTVTEQRKG